MTTTSPLAMSFADRCLLIVEDSGALARALELRITALGGSSVLIGSFPGVQRRYPAWKQAQQARAEETGKKVPLFDAIVTDYQLLGNGTGLDVVRWLHEQEGVWMPQAILFTANIYTVQEDIAHLGLPISAFFASVIAKTGDAREDIGRVMEQLAVAIQASDENVRRYS